jgi:hypothetical protein
MKRDGTLTAEDLDRRGRRSSAEECPFSWTQQKEGCVFSTQVWKPVKCRGAACKLWSGEDCVFNTILDRLAHLQDALSKS